MQGDRDPPLEDSDSGQTAYEDMPHEHQVSSTTPGAMAVRDGLISEYFSRLIKKSLHCNQTI